MCKKLFCYIFLSCALFLSFSNFVYAKSGCCSGHGGVDCSRAQSNGKVICADGWTGSACSYSSITQCSGYTQVNTTTDNVESVSSQKSTATENSESTASASATSETSVSIASTSTTSTSISTSITDTTKQNGNAFLGFIETMVIVGVVVYLYKKFHKKR